MSVTKEDKVLSSFLCTGVRNTGVRNTGVRNTGVRKEISSFAARTPRGE